MQHLPGLEVRRYCNERAEKEEMKSFGALKFLASPIKYCVLASERLPTSTSKMILYPYSSLRRLRC
jgi:hypothetical protein